MQNLFQRKKKNMAYIDTPTYKMGGERGMVLFSFVFKGMNLL